MKRKMVERWEIGENRERRRIKERKKKDQKKESMVEGWEIGKNRGKKGKTKKKIKI